jgi:hypothetical protein
LAVISYAGFLREFSFTLSLLLAVRFLIVDIDRHQKVDLRIHFDQVRVPFLACLAIPYVLVLSMGWWDSEATGTPAQAAFVVVYGFTYLIVELQQSGVGIG